MVREAPSSQLIHPLIQWSTLPINSDCVPLFLTKGPLHTHLELSPVSSAYVTNPNHCKPSYIMLNLVVSLLINRLTDQLVRSVIVLSRGDVAVAIRFHLIKVSVLV